jgi:ATP-dependent helicase HrpB
LALCLDARRQLGGALRLVIMSATLEGERVVQLLGDAALVQVPGRAFPVAVRYLGRGAPILPGGGADAGRDSQRLVQGLARAVQVALEETAGDVLVFLPGVGEIRRLEGALAQASLPAAVRVLSLFGQMSAAAQDAVLAPAAAGTRKVVLATNIAETSLTIPGITAVVDSGLVRRSRFDPVTGMSRLDLERIARSASEQRAGRAGRVAPGICYRLWSEGAHSSLAAATAPEILEADLASLALELVRWGGSDAAPLAWLDAPPAPMLQQARALLARLGALDAQHRLTSLGHEMARLPVHPRLAAMLLAARGLDAVPLAAQLAALLSERDLLGGGAGANEPDLAARLDLLAGSAHRDARERLQRSARALQGAVQGLARSAPLRQAPEWPAALGDERVGALLACGFPDRIGQRREGTQGRYLLANGRGAAFARPNSLARSPFIVAAALDDREREARIDLAAALPRTALEQLFAAQLTAEESCGWDTRQAAVLWRRVRRLEALVLEDQTRAPPDGPQTVAAMLAGVRALGLDALPWDRQTRSLQARMQFVGSLGRADVGSWPASDDAALSASIENWLAPWLDGITRREHLARLALADALRERLTGAQRRSLETLAPREIVVPTGSHIAIDYLDDNAPCVAVRLQEVFGLEDTPRIGGGTVPLTFKLLSPAQRPVQITRDLGGFWRSSYAAVRKDMRGRYPRHAWPENPLAATPTRGATRRRAKGD